MTLAEIEEAARLDPDARPLVRKPWISSLPVHDRDVRATREQHDI